MTLPIDEVVHGRCLGTICESNLSTRVVKHREGHVIRPRIIVYGVILLAIIVGTLYSMANRVPLRADLIRDRNALYRELPGDLIENVYTLKVTNMDGAPHSYTLTALNNDQVEIDLADPLDLGAEQVAAIIVRLRLPRCGCLKVTRCSPGERSGTVQGVV